MKAKPALWIGVAIAIAACSGSPAPTLASERGAPVNRIVGDSSWIARHGAPPAGDVDEIERVQTHLAWAADRLAATTPAGLSSAAARNRAARIADLRRYAAGGVFPQLEREAPDGRVPRFRDHLGTWCAVGWLVVASGEEPFAAMMARDHEYARIAEIDDPGLDRWAAQQGFTRTELATIQPEYSFMHRCSRWGTGAEDCPDGMVRKNRLAFDFGLGGGVTRDQGLLSSYFLWGFGVRYAIASWLSFGVGDLGVRVGHATECDVAALGGALCGSGNHVALVATPYIELSRWSTGYNDQNQKHLDIGLTTERVFADAAPNRTPLGLQVALGYRTRAARKGSIDFSVGAVAALDDGFVVGDMLKRGGIAPFVKLGVAFRP